jgi:hypothetical protein
VHVFGLLTSPELAHDQAMIGLAAAIDGANPHDLWERLDAAALPMFGLGRSGLREQAAALAETITTRTCRSASARPHRWRRRSCEPAAHTTSPARC